MDSIITADESKSLSDEGKGLVTAEEMKALADDRQDTVSRYNRIVAKIREAAALGLYSITFHDFVGREIGDRLWNDGFYVKLNWKGGDNFESFTYISWKFEPDREKEQERRDYIRRSEERQLNKRMASTP